MPPREELIASIESGRAARGVWDGSGPGAALTELIARLGEEALELPASDRTGTMVLKARREGLLLFRLSLESLAASGEEAERELDALDAGGAVRPPCRLA